MAEPSGDAFQDMCTMIGLMVISWAWSENALALAIGIIDETVEEMRGHKELPVSLKKRLDYLRTALKDVPALEPIKEEGTALIKLFVELKERRHELIHGSTWQLDQGGFEAHLSTIKGRKHLIEQKRVEIGDVVLFNIEVDKLGEAALSFLTRIDAIYS